MKRRRKAFSLVELMVVTGILALLAAILFPVLASAKKAAKKAVSIANASQTGKAILLYSTDHDDLPPPYCGDCHFSAGPAPTWEDGPNTWMVLLLPFIGAKAKSTSPFGYYLPADLPELFFDANEKKNSVSGCTSFGSISSWGISDVIVDRLGTASDPGRNRVRSLASFGDSSNTVLLAQTSDYGCRGRGVAGFALAFPPRLGALGWSAATTLDGIYGGSARLNMVIFLDSSVRLTPLSRLTTENELWGINP